MCQEIIHPGISGAMQDGDDQNTAAGIVEYPGEGHGDGDRGKGEEQRNQPPLNPNSPDQ